jgi:hypothetical protein
MFRQSEGRQRPLADGTVIGDHELSLRSLLLEHGATSASNRRIDSCRACQRVQSGREHLCCLSNDMARSPWMASGHSMLRLMSLSAFAAC